MPFLISLVFFTNKTKAQNLDFTYYKIEISGEKNQVMEMMNNQYKKEIYVNNENCYYVKKLDHHIEIIQYNSDKAPIRFYILKNNSLFVNETYQYFDSNIDELSLEEQDLLKSYYQINKDITRDIHGFKCFQVQMKDPSDSDTNVVMYVSESLPNLPNHIPLASNILNAEPLQIHMSLFGMDIKVEIVETENKVNIEDRMNIKFSEAISITEEEYIKLKNG